MPDRQDFRCHNCNFSMYKADGNIDTEIICASCHRINYPHRQEDPAFGLRGKDFQMIANDIVCPVSQRLLMRVIGDGTIEIYSRYCKKTWIFDTVLTRMGKKPISVEPLTEEDKAMAVQNRANLAR